MINLRRFVASSGLVVGTFVFLHPASAQIPDSTASMLSLDSLLSIPISTAAKYAQTVSEAPASVSVITAHEIEQYGYRTITEALSHLPGFYVSNDRNYSYIGVRGFSRPTDYNNRILMLLNGHTVNENYFDGAITETLPDLDVVERLEIIRGPGSALYGSSAMFAVVNVVTKTGRSLDKFTTRAGVASYGARTASADFGRELADGLDILLSGSWGDSKGHSLYFAEYDDPSTNGGVSEDLDWEEYYRLYGKVSFKGFTLSAMKTSRTKGIPTAPWGVLFNNPGARTHDAQAFAELRFDRDLGADKDIVLRGYFDSFSYEGAYPYDPADGGVFWDENRGRWAGAEAQFRWDPVAADRIKVGVEYRRHLRAGLRTGSASGVDVDTDFPFVQLSLYAQNELQLNDDLSLTTGVRLDHSSDADQAVTPRGALVYHPTRSTTFKFLYGEAFRVPNRWEAHYEEAGFGKVNPDLVREKIRTAELVWEQRLAGWLFATTSLYDYRMTDLIDEIVDPVDDLSTYRNVSRVNARGIEFALNARLRGGHSGYLAYALQHAHDGQTQEDLSNSPQHLVRVGVAAALPSDFVAAADVSYDHDRLTVQNTSTDGFVLANVSLRTGALLNHFRFSLAARNIFNARYQLPGGFEHVQPGIPQDGRNFRIRLEFAN